MISKVLQLLLIIILLNMTHASNPKKSTETIALAMQQTSQFDKTLPVVNEYFLSDDNTKMSRIDIFNKIYTAPSAYNIDVPLITQFPELYNGCEITSLAMLLDYMGLDYSKMDLAERIVRDKTPITWGDNGTIIRWGNPDVGFVGDITGSKLGYSVNNGPVEDLMNEITGNKSVNLTGSDFDEILKAIMDDKPVVVWTTVYLQPVSDRDWIEWVTPDNETVKATFKVHAVLLVGYDENYVYVNNPLNGVKNEKVEMESFIASWKQLGKQAITYSE